MGSLMEKAIAAIVRQAFERPPPRKPVDDKAAADALVAESKRAAERVERYGSSAYLDAPSHRQPVASINKRFLLNTIRDADSHNKDVQQKRRGRSARDRSPARLGADSASRRRRDDSDSVDSGSDDEDEDFMKRLNRMPKRGRGAVGARVDVEDQVDSAASAAVESEESLRKNEQMGKDKKKKGDKKKNKKKKKNKDK